ncbi:hypothetical protein M0Q97_02180 [Candidatus Dojkabacteria bacterium]|jgi:hypothetical protein|nr:hypothetical protein [Candidatus Dojkabacteria bacterium]
MENVLYHITTEKNLNQILVGGLKINTNKVGFCKFGILKTYNKKYGCQPIFLTNDYEFTLKKDIGNFKNLYLLTINTFGLPIENELDYLKNNWQLFYNTEEEMIENLSMYFDKHFICKTDIDFNRIIEVKKI